MTARRAFARGSDLRFIARAANLADGLPSAPSPRPVQAAFARCARARRFDAATESRFGIGAPASPAIHASVDITAAKFDWNTTAYAR